MLILFLLLSTASASQISYGGTEVKVNTKGEFNVTRGQTLKLKFTKLYELEQNEKVVTEDFLRQDFKITKKDTDEANTLIFRRSFPNKGNMEVSVLIYKNAKTITAGNDTYEVKSGDVKWNVELNWSFLPNSDSLQLSMDIEDNPTKTDDKFISGDFTLTLPNIATIDGQARNITVEKLQFTFPKFNNLVYEPLIQMKEPSALEIVLGIVGGIVGIIVVGLAIYSYTCSKNAMKNREKCCKRQQRKFVTRDF